MDAFAAGELRGHCAQGQTVPLYLACRVGKGEVVYQTKLAGRRSGLSARELGVELLGTTLAHDSGLHVARPAMITLPPKVVDAVEREYGFGIEDVTAFGVVWKAGLTPFLPDVELSSLDEAGCARLIALDLLLTNGDRTEPNPNVCWEGDRLLVFDFEHCLELPRVTFARRLDFHLQTLGPALETHLMASQVGKRALSTAVTNVLAAFAVDAYKRDAFSLPQSWHEEWLDNVEYLGYIKQNSAALLERIEGLAP